MSPDTDLHAGLILVPDVWPPQAWLPGTRQERRFKVASLAIDAMWQGPLKSDPRAAVWLTDSIGVCKTLGLNVSMICCFELHFKDDKHLLGQGRIEFKKVREAIDAAGYRGWIQLEAAAPHGIMVDYRSQGEYVRNLFPRSDA